MMDTVSEYISFENESLMSSSHAKGTEYGRYYGSINVDGERHGKGFAIYDNGDMYLGNFRHMTRYGEGVYIFKDGSRYVGHYKNGLRNGWGQMQYADGSVYKGSWRNNLKHGQGIYYYANGDKYDGAWYKGKCHGLGKYIFKDSNIEFFGVWIYGVRNGSCRLKFPTYTFEGVWNDHRPTGFGRYNFNSLFCNNGYYDYVDEQPIWYSLSMSSYKYEDGPPEPIPPPFSDSEESILSISSESETNITTAITNEAEE